MSVLSLVMGASLIAHLPSSAAQPPSQPPPGCEVNFETMMALNIQAFDQDMNGGWRVLARREECRGTAADLIRLYRQNVESRMRLLYWHEGQLRSGLGETEAAIALFEQSRRQDSDEYGWNHYVDATVAFLRRDRAALEAARARLARARVPDYGNATGLAQLQHRPSGPMNLNVVDAFIRCFDRPYPEAYGKPECRQPQSP